MKKQVRVTGEKVFKSQTDKVLDTLGNIDNTTGSQDISTAVQPDTLKKLTFQIRDSIYRQLIKSHNAFVEKLGDDAPDREVMVEEAIASLLYKLNDDEEKISAEDLTSDIAHRQRIRQQELKSGALINPSSRKKK